jgi:ABC-2 type transport system permease protein
MRAVLERELKSYFRSPTGYVFAAFLLLFVGIYTMAINFSSGYANFEYVLSNMSFVFLIIIPILTMRMVAEERRQKTDLLLYSLPMSMGKIVLGKYFASLLVLLVPVSIVCLYPIILFMYGTINFLPAYSAILAFFLLGATLIAIGMFISSVTENQVIAAILSFIVLLVNFFISQLSNFISSSSSTSFIALTIAVILLAVILRLLTKNGYFAVGFALVCEIGLTAVLYLAPSSLEGLFPKIMQGFSVFDRFNSFIDGVFDITSIVYFLMAIVVFIFLTVQSLEKRRWN